MADPLLRLHGAHPERAIVLDHLPTRWRVLAADADLRDDHVVGALIWLVGGAMLSAAVWLVVDPWLAGIALTLVCATPPVMVARRRGRRSARLVEALPLVVETIVRSLRSGASLVQSLGEAAATAPPIAGRELQRVTDQIRLGRTVADALRSWAARDDRPEVRIVAAALATAGENEAGTGHALTSVAQSLRDRATLQAEVRTHAAQAVASMYALVLLPVAFLGLDLVGSGKTTDFLLGTAPGRLCFALAVVLDVSGWAWMQSVVRRRMPA